MLKKYLHLGLAALAAGLLAMPAAADTVTATFNSVSPSTIFYYTLNGSGLAAYTGQINWTRTGGTQPGLPETAFSTFCIELTQHIQLNHSYTYDVMDLSQASNPAMGEGKAQDIGRLWAKYHPLADDSPNNAAAFQVAIWEILYDTDHLLNAGHFRAKYPTAAPATIAQGWLSDLSWNGALPNLLAMKSATAQDQVFVGPPPTPEYGNPVAAPLPGAAWGGAVLLGLLAGRRFCKRRAIPL